MTRLPTGRKVACLIALLAGVQGASADDWPQWRGPDRDGVWHEKDVPDRFPAGGLKIRWRAAVGPGYSSPVVGDGRVFVTDCELGPKEKRQAKERVWCLDEATGRCVWTYSYRVNYPDYAWPPDADPGQGPTPTPVVHAGKLYTVGGLGHLFCFDARNGAVLWKKDLARDYRVGEFCIRGSPLVAGNLLVVDRGYGKSFPGVIAFDKDSGREVWKALDEGGYNSSPLVIEAGGKSQLVVPGREWVTSLDPETGRTYWRERFAGGIPTPVYAKNRLLVNGLMFALDPDKPAASVLWPPRKSDAQLSDTTTAIFYGDLIFSHKKGNLLVCLDMATGRQLWSTDRLKSLLHGLARCGDGMFVFTDQGELIRVRLTARGYEEVGRARLIRPTTKDGKRWVVYAAPAYANRHVFARNDEELLCASLAAGP